ncbi:MFS transporter [Arthrobacter sp. B2a2-09]|uniref:MFS transporter n=1 Tax=Arthrobacter sp. B2a2-09 TaxID=2952822 RepID=UPI0022CD75E0|nr:MFS transporter [Arthrobacter sp. B2a2-09]MCZ9880628.1 MFS transporter [Arthrobacter sp. B2a2-09]
MPTFRPIEELTEGPSADAVADSAVARAEPNEPQKKLKAGYLVLLALAYFGAAMAGLVPSAYSLTLRVQQLAPGHEEVLGFLTSIGSFAVVILNPLLGMLSDRTQSRLGRRRPYMIGGTLLGLVGLLIIAVAPTIVIVGIGWVIATVSLGMVLGAATFIQADLLPESQRGRVSGLIGLTAQIAPVVGVLLASRFTSDNLLLFMIPGVIALLFVGTFLIFTKDDYKAPVTQLQRLTLPQIFRSYVFNPRQSPDFSWNWMGRFLFFSGLFINTTFSAFFYSQRLGIPVAAVAGVTAILGILGVGVATGGSVLSGYLSDKFRRRRLFVLIGAALFACGAGVEAFASSFPVLAVGSILMSLAMAAFFAVDQAICIESLPNRDEAGRYFGILGFSQKIPSAIAPLIATGLVSIGATSNYKNYTLAYLIGGMLGLAGGMIVFFKVRSIH